LRARGLQYKLQCVGPTGTNAVEAALKLARKVTGRSNVVAFTNAYHGCTLGALATTGNRNYRNASQGELGHVYRAVYDGYHDGVDGAGLLQRMFDDPSSGFDNVAAIILECVQGEGGFNVATPQWAQKIAAVARAHGTLLILDEIQTGCGRTGDFFAFESLGIQPDIVTMAKSLSGFGLPLAMVMMRPELDAWEPGEHTGTFRGNAPAFVTGTVALEKFWTDAQLMTRVRAFERRITEELSRPQLWRRLWLVCISPAFHGRYLFNRLRHNFWGPRPVRRGLAVLWWSAVAGLLVSYPHLLLPVAVGYFLPVLLLYNVSSFLELICEHVWMRPIASPSARQRITELIWGRFCGDAVPAGRGALAWLRWCARMLFYHLPCRMFVLTGDAPQHDFHHIVPNGWRWTMSAYERQDTITAHKMEDREVWGLFAAIDIVFRHFSTVQDHPSELVYLEAKI
jgi:hypothetical protein